MTDLTEVLVNIVFPEQLHEYIIAVSQQTEAYRKPRYTIPDYLSNRPHNVQAACLASISKSKQFIASDVTTNGNGLFTLRSSERSYRVVDIPGGCCECPYFSKTKFPCKHTFTIFSLFAEQWSWHDLPDDLTESTYMTLEASLLEQGSACTTISTGDMPDASTYTIDSTNENQKSDDKLKDNSDVDHSVDVEMDNGNTSREDDEPVQKIPKAQMSAHKLQSLQKNAHAVLTKCKDLCYLTTDCSVLEDVIKKAEKLYCELVESVAADSSSTINSLPVFPVLAKASVDNARKKKTTVPSNQSCKASPSKFFFKEGTQNAMYSQCGSKL